MMKCPICSQTIRDDAVFCGQCGKKVPRCPTCGTVITERTPTCPKDGTPLTEDIIALFPAVAAASSQVFTETAADAQAHMETAATSLTFTEETAGITNQAASGAKCVRCGTPVAIGQQLCSQCLSIVQADAAAPQNTNKKRLPLWLAIAAAAAVCVIGFSVFSGRSSSRPEPQKENGFEENDFKNSLTTAGAGETSPGQTEKPEHAETADENMEPSTEPPSGKIVHTYEVIASDVTWQEAKKDCEARGGHLATIGSMEEYETIVSLLTDSDLYYLWLGASLHSGYDEWEDNSWITGEEWTLPNSLWYPGEPSKEDLDGTKEYYLCLWNAKYEEQDIGWTLNDQRNDIVGDFPALAGKLGYICEYETEINE